MKAVIPALMILLAASAAMPNRLSDTCAHLKPGQWAAFESGLTEAMVGNGAGYMFDYGEQVEWDPQSSQLMYMGESHGGSGGLANVIRYYAEEDRWATTLTPRDPQVTANRMGHSYDHSDYVEATREYYYGTYVEDPNRPGQCFYKYSFASNRWDTILTYFPGNYINFIYAGGMAFFPEIHSFVFFSGYLRNVGSIADIEDTARGDTLHFRAFQPMDESGHPILTGFYSTLVEYVKAHHCLVVISNMGSFVLDTNLQCRTIHPPNIWDDDQFHLIDEPVTGTLLVQESGGPRRLFAYSIPDDRWQELPMRPSGIMNGSFPLASVFGTIKDYGAIVMLRAEAPRFCIYKYTNLIDTLPLTGIEVIPGSSSVEEYLSTPLTVITHYQGGALDTVTNSCFYRTLDSSHALMELGAVVRMQEAGQAQIEVLKRNARGFVKDTLVITVVPGTASLQGVTLSPRQLKLMAGDTYALQAIGRYLSGSYSFTRPLRTGVTWTSPDANAAQVDDNGAVTGVAAGGPVKVYGSFGGKSDSCLVTVMPKPSFIRRINFQPSSRPWSYGWLADSGIGFLTTQSYGWTNPASLTHADTGQGVNYLLRTFVKTPSRKAYKIACPDGDYILKIAMGDNVLGGNDTLWSAASALLTAHTGVSNKTFIDTLTASNNAGIVFIFNGSLDYLVLISKQGIDINAVADDQGVTPVPVPVRAVKTPVMAALGRCLVAVPNPFNPCTNIRCAWAGLSRARYAIYDVRGRLVNEWRLTQSPAVIRWDGRDASGSLQACGLYVGKLSSQDGKTVTHKLLRTK